jgi:hypothetical protein
MIWEHLSFVDEIILLFGLNGENRTNRTVNLHLITVPTAGILSLNVEIYAKKVS